VSGRAADRVVNRPHAARAKSGNAVAEVRDTIAPKNRAVREAAELAPYSGDLRRLVEREGDAEIAGVLTIYLPVSMPVKVAVSKVVFV
jgi:hypothetical protein